MTDGEQHLRDTSIGCLPRAPCGGKGGVELGTQLHALDQKHQPETLRCSAPGSNHGATPTWGPVRGFKRRAEARPSRCQHGEPSRVSAGEGMAVLATGTTVGVVLFPGLASDFRPLLRQASERTCRDRPVRSAGPSSRGCCGARHRRASRHPALHLGPAGRRLDGSG